MMIWLSLFEHQTLCQQLCSDLGGKLGTVEMRSFPDGETYLNCLDAYSGKKVIIVDSLNDPNEKLVPLILLCQNLKELGASEIGFVCPYLCYMRQDKRFKPGEAMSSTSIAKLLSSYVDWLITVDPHLHRITSLSEIYPIQSQVIHAAPVVAKWIKDHIQSPCLIGPDSESKQWVRAMADEIGCPYYVLNKQRLGDKEVHITLPDVFDIDNHSPVLVDDMISSAGTMLTAIELIYTLTHKKPHCVAIHGLFSNDSFSKLQKANIESIVTTDTLHHPSNQITLIEPIKKGIEQIIKSR